MLSMHREPSNVPAISNGVEDISRNTKIEEARKKLKKFQKKRAKSPTTSEGHLSKSSSSSLVSVNSPNQNDPVNLNTSVTPTFTQTSLVGSANGSLLERRISSSTQSLEELANRLSQLSDTAADVNGNKSPPFMETTVSSQLPIDLLQRDLNAEKEKRAELEVKLRSFENTVNILVEEKGEYMTRFVQLEKRNRDIEGEHTQLRLRLQNFELDSQNNDELQQRLALLTEELHHLRHSRDVAEQMVLEEKSTSKLKCQELEETLRSQATTIVNLEKERDTLKETLSQKPNSKDENDEAPKLRRQSDILISQLQNELRQSQTHTENVESSLLLAQQELSEYRRRCERLTDDISELNNNISTKVTEITNLRSDIVSLQLDNQSLRDAMEVGASPATVSEEDLKSLKEELSSTRSLIETLQKEKDRLIDDSRRDREKTARLAMENSDFLSQLEELRQKTIDLSQEKLELMEKLDSERAKSAKLSMEMGTSQHYTEEIGRLKEIIRSLDPATSDTSQNQIAEAQAKEIEKLKQHKSDLESSLFQINSEKEQLSLKLQDLQDEKTIFEEMKDQYKKITHDLETTTMKCSQLEEQLLLANTNMAELKQENAQLLLLYTNSSHPPYDFQQEELAADKPEQPSIPALVSQISQDDDSDIRHMSKTILSKYAEKIEHLESQNHMMKQQLNSLEVLRQELDSSKMLYHEIQSHLNIVQNENERLKVEKEELTKKLETEISNNDLLSMEMESLPDFIELYHQERRALQVHSAQTINKLKEALVQSLASGSTSPPAKPIEPILSSFNDHTNTTLTATKLPSPILSRKSSISVPPSLMDSRMGSVSNLENVISKTGIHGVVLNGLVLEMPCCRNCKGEEIWL
ncbi:hypothetical protein BKA69DRAFT_731128 [Paraphysoderma sedebokerense]|nr:hypothetical protein BKA69DRAFT_731128 [Paraphysoderma sedebokerense]